MRREPLPIFVAWLLLVSGASLGAGRVADFDGSAESGLRLLLLGEDRAPQWPLAPRPPASGADAAVLVRSLIRAGPAGELRRRLSELSERLKRKEPLTSLDLTFHLLRRMLEISRVESHQQQAKENRLVLDNLGK